MDNNHIITSVTDSILTITIARESAKNALSLNMYSQLTAALQQLDDDPTISVAIITGGENCFTAGNDLKDFLAGGALNEQHPTVQFLYQIASTKKPIIAAVAGPAIGIGTTMLLHCDLVYAADNTIFQLPFAQLGLCPEAACSEMLPRITGHVKAFEMVVLGDRFSANDALEIGLINKVCSSDTLLSLAVETATRITKLPENAVSTSKSLLKSNTQERVLNTIKAELTQFEMLLNSEQSQKIISSFFSKK
ncbi:enoyl-CoA hydratase [Psychrosphaera saromensis]|uniref:Enoyl-CoA hydratase n=1 Tax=Psychrosphaera saromensis TaxID=716813 RepID=A0A2S7UVS1_9GAMM|nr:enoyl-CoA hydratase-related protein [Psychrosphaera saromensis]PQJ53838.1 enoyl-CoA hydratase [Psychrosphaera saromensis]GHB62013.1 enoyl-CoA hydratase [Psychrosphaera saromensis]GLQ15369.1 enoyl-CoA hydratase [Psychrosphaera saromensis]